MLWRIQPKQPLRLRPPFTAADPFNTPCPCPPTCPSRAAGKVHTPGTKTLYSTLRCEDLAFLDLLERCLR